MPNKFTSELYHFIDLILPEWEIIVGIRSRIFKLVYNSGKKPYILKGNRITQPNNFFVGDKFGMNRENIFDDQEKISFGNNCMGGFRNLFLTVNHVEKGKQRKEEKIYYKPITIGNDVWITSNCTILPGTIIEDNVILSAGSVASGVLESG